jgi:KUP system potassium uptake protein
MVITTLLFAVVARERWRWGWPRVLAVAGFFLAIDLAFWLANILKIPHGGWFPLVVGGLIFGLMATWKRGRLILQKRLEDVVLPLDLFLQDVARNCPPRVPGTAVFMYSDPNSVPPALLHNMKHNKVLHERVVFLIVETENVPHIDSEERARADNLESGFYRVTLHYGFMEEPDVPQALSGLQRYGLEFKHLETTYFLGRETLIPSAKPGMAIWREHIFTVMHRNARPATSFFRLPPNRVVELGAQIEL